MLHIRSTKTTKNLYFFSLWFWKPLGVGASSSCLGTAPSNILILCCFNLMSGSGSDCGLPAPRKGNKKTGKNPKNSNRKHRNCSAAPWRDNQRRLGRLHAGLTQFDADVIPNESLVYFLEGVLGSFTRNIFEIVWIYKFKFEGKRGLLFFWLQWNETIWNRLVCVRSVARIVSLISE